MKVLRIFLFLMPCAMTAQTSSIDFFPLTVGYHWTYTYYYETSNVFPAYGYSVSGTADYAILSSIAALDSVIWNFQEMRSGTYRETDASGNTTSGPLKDSTLFNIVEHQNDNHRIFMPTGTIVPYIFLQEPFLDSVQFSRYYPGVSEDTLTFVRNWSTSAYSSYDLNASFQKAVGLIQLSFHKSYYGFGQHGNVILSNAVVTSVQRKKSIGHLQGFVLHQNYPNPFNPITVIPITVYTRSEVTIRIYDMLGRMVETIFRGPLEAGNHSIIWNASKQPSGVYVCLMRTNNESKSISVIVLK